MIMGAMVFKTNPISSWGVIGIEDSFCPGVALTRRNVGNRSDKNAIGAKQALKLSHALFFAKRTQFIETESIP